MKEHLSINSYINVATRELVHYENSDKETSHRLTMPESKILLCLLRKQGEIVAKDELLTAGWGSHVMGDNSLNVAIYRIRKCLSDNNKISLENTPKIGYKLVVDEENTLQISNDSSLENNEKDKELEVFSFKKLPTRVHKILRGKDLVTKPIFERKIILVSMFLIINILIGQFYIFIFSNNVNVKCEENGEMMICYSDGYSGVFDTQSSGLNVVSNMFTFNNNEVNWSEE